MIFIAENMFPVRYNLNFCIFCRINSVLLFLACNSLTNKLLYVSCNPLFPWRNSAYVREFLGNYISYLPNYCLEVIMHSEGHVTGHLNTVLHGFYLSVRQCWDASQVPNCYCVLLMHPSRHKLFKLSLIGVEATSINFANYVGRH
jgi:hypothetical protein